jgi:hypothetical protein
MLFLPGIKPGNTSLKKAMEGINTGDRFFRSVKPKSGFVLVVTMETGATIHFNFLGRLNTLRFEALRDEALFQSVYTDGSSLIFDMPNRERIILSAFEFMDLVLIDKSRWGDA